MAFIIPDSVTLETVVRTGKSNSDKAAGRVGEYKTIKQRLSGRKGRGAAEQKRRRCGGGKEERVRETESENPRKMKVD